MFLEYKGKNIFRTVEKVELFGHGGAPKKIAKGTTDPGVDCFNQ